MPVWVLDSELRRNCVGYDPMAATELSLCLAAKCTRAWYWSEILTSIGNHWSMLGCCRIIDGLAAKTAPANELFYSVAILPFFH